MNTRSSTTVMWLIGPLLLFASTFPYIQFTPSSSYTQPQAYVLGILLFPFCLRSLFRLRKTDSISIISLTFIGLVLFVITCFPYNNPQEYKYFLVYLSPLLFIPVFLTTIQTAPIQTIKVLQVSIALWLLVSTVQVFIEPNFATSLLGPWSNSTANIISSGRGVLGLAPEPTHNGFHTLLLGAALSLIDNSRLSRFLTFGCIGSAVFLAASGSALLVLVLGTLFWMLRCKPLLGITAVVVGVILVKLSPLILLEQLNTDSRIGILLRLFFENPADFLTVDYSVNVRLGGFWITLRESFLFGLFPHGLSQDAWLKTREGILETNDWLLGLSLAGPPSGIGLLMFQCGFLAVPFLTIFIRRLYTNLPTTITGQVITISVLFIFFSQFYLSSPMFSMIYAFILRKDYIQHIFSSSSFRIPTQHNNPTSLQVK